MENKRLYSPTHIKDILDRYGFKFSKSLGQNNIIDVNILRKIVEESYINKDTYLLEIGPGIGTLTEELALNAKSPSSRARQKPIANIRRKPPGL